LADAFPSPPGRPGKYVLYLDKAEDADGMLTEVHIWAAPYAALKFLEIVLDEDDFVMLTSEKLRTETGIIVTCDRLTEVIEHEYTVAEAIWQMPEPHRTMARRFRGMGDVAGRIAALERAAAGFSEEREAKKARKATGATRSKPGGYVDIGVIAQELGMEGRECRAILRAKVEKPKTGWNWPNSEVEAVKEILRKGKKG
jgi:hypothetical protein